ncbi:hypothetical protein SAMN02990966_07954 [Rhodospirillales bacterium URHD0017]|nr:hypothetical protein SAMN02990966_07954 [Rhodospirillales bacterium URHD0017]
MPIPLLLLVPWNPPAPPSPPSNPWVPESSVNLWDVIGLAAKLDELTEEIRKLVGTEISLTDLISLLGRFVNDDDLSDSERVQVIQMGSYFARNTGHWTLAPDNLDHWLEAGGLQDPAQIMDYTLIKDQDPVIDTLVDKHYDVIVDGIKKRLLAPPGVEFPASPTTFTGPFGAPIEVEPAESPLAAGGEETLYYESSTRTTGDSRSDLFNAVNAVNLVSQVQVKSEVLYTGEWQVTIVDWQVWFWDSYDWNKNNQFVSIPLNLMDRLPPDLAQYRSTIEDALKRNSLDLSALQSITVHDSQMSKIEGKKVAMPDGSTKQPKAYPIYSNGSWSFDASTYDKDTVLTIPPP